MRTKKHECTLALIKPDAVEAAHIGGIIGMIEASGLRIAAMKTTRLTLAQAKAFYEVHRKRPFYRSLTRFMSSGPIVAMVLEGEHAIARWRELMGPTDSHEAPETTVRGRFGTDKERNAVHGSDARETAEKEIRFFFPVAELIRR